MKSTEEIKNRLTLALHRRNLTPKELPELQAETGNKKIN